MANAVKHRDYACDTVRTAIRHQRTERESATLPPLALRYATRVRRPDRDRAGTPTRERKPRTGAASSGRSSSSRDTSPHLSTSLLSPPFTPPYPLPPPNPNPLRAPLVAALHTIPFPYLREGRDEGRGVSGEGSHHPYFSRSPEHEESAQPCHAKLA